MELGDTEMMDPNPDIFALFCYYNTLYFADALGSCIVSWSSKRMTLCAGICRYLSGGGCEIRLSEPLLKFRSSADLKNTLLHEMIHAYLWIRNKNQDHSDHGPNFQKLMKEINSSSVIDYQRPNGGYNVTIYHSFHDEVNSYRVHHWKCQSCGDLIKRAMNRKPSASDCIEKVRHDGFCGNPSCHWHGHKMSCTGIYEKIAEPPGYKDTSRGSKGKQGFDGVKSKESTHATKSVRKARKTVGSEDKSDTQKLKTIDKFYSIISDVNRNSDSSPPSGEDIQKSLSPDKLRATEEKAQDREVHVKTSDLDKIHMPRKKQRFIRIGKKSTHMGSNVPRKDENNYNVIIEWKGWYANEGEEDEEEMEPLHNKRTERRRKQKLLKNPTGDVFKVEATNNASDTSCSLKNISIPVSHTLSTKGEDVSAMDHINCVRQKSGVLVEDFIDTREADANDSIDYYQKGLCAYESEPPSTSQQPQLCAAGTSINYTVTSQDSPDASDGYGKRSIAGYCFEGADRDNIVDISDS
ncbi:uncharacterized protein LOC143877810 isoform X2 [Tasmannia lanceolata]|uniref:uncharacterized protein LOC143877810 isoform X2 n=1 Tax=Tasmannia lanceolata TaxID=3420 RepID=UPI0040645516